MGIYNPEVVTWYIQLLSQVQMFLVFFPLRRACGSQISSNLQPSELLICHFQSSTGASPILEVTLQVHIDKKIKIKKREKNKIKSPASLLS